MPQKVRKAIFPTAGLGTRYDAGDKLGFLIATVEFGLKHSELAAEFRNYLGSRRDDR